MPLPKPLIFKLQTPNSKLQPPTYSLPATSNLTSLITVYLVRTHTSHKTRWLPEYSSRLLALLQASSPADRPPQLKDPSAAAQQVYHIRRAAVSNPVNRIRCHYIDPEAPGLPLESASFILTSISQHFPLARPRLTRTRLPSPFFHLLSFRPLYIVYPSHLPMAMKAPMKPLAPNHRMQQCRTRRCQNTSINS